MTIKSGVYLGRDDRRGAMAGAGAVVTKDVEPDTVVVGNPARGVRRLEPSHT